MRIRRILLAVVGGTAVVLPLLFSGASCPPPRSPGFYFVVPDNNQNGSAPISSCIDGFVCINFANESSLSVDMALYLHDGFDPDNEYADPPDFSCCTNPNSPVACVCPCDGADEGECQLNRDEIFEPENLQTINGSQTITLLPNASILADRVRCEDVKTIGAALAETGMDVLTMPADEAGPTYRDEPGGVPCGQTVQYTAVNLNDTGSGSGGGDGDLVTLILQVDISQ